MSRAAAIQHRFCLRLEDKGAALLYDRAKHKYFRPSAAQTFLMVASCEMPVADAIEHLSQSVGADEANEALALLAADDVLDAERPFGGRVVQLEALEGAWGAPLVAHLGVTLACNFSCAHCYSSSGKRLPDELTLSEIENLVDQLASMGCQKLVLGGGEPFLRKDLARVVRYADGAGIDCYIHTNASLLAPEVLRELAACLPAGLSVSLDGPDAEGNDRVRGAGTYQRALKGIALLREHYPPGFNISVTIGPHNALEAARIVEMAHQEGAKVLLLRPAYPAGEAQKAAAELVCDRETFSRAIDRARVRAAELGVSVDAPHPEEAGIPDFDGFGCVAARVVLGISPNGSVTPCLNLPSSFMTGNLRSTPLSTLWRRGKAFAVVRGQKPNPQCASCAHYDTCRGGCRVRALFAGNGLDGPDSWCHYEPKIGLAPVSVSKPQSLGSNSRS